MQRADHHMQMRSAWHCLNLFLAGLLRPAEAPISFNLGACGGYWRPRSLMERL